MRVTRGIACAVCAIWAAALPAADATGAKANLSVIERSLTLDRTEYFPGEEALLTFRVKNPTQQPLEIPAPFLVGTTAVELAKRAESGTFEPVLAAAEPLDTTPTITLGSGQEMVRRLWSTEPQFDQRASFFVTGSLPLEPGYYKATAGYLGESATFQVVRPTVEKAVSLVGRDGVDEGLGSIRFFQRVVMSLERDGASYICVSRTDSLMDRTQRLAAGRPLAKSIGSYRRVARSDAPVVELHAALTPQNQIEITWQDATGKTGQVTVDLDLNPV